MSTEKPRKPFGYCRHGEHWKCPIVIDIVRVDGGGQYRKYFVWMSLSYRGGRMRTCEVIEYGVKCEVKHFAKGMCKKHWKRARKHGDPLVVERVFEKREHEKWCSGCKAWLSKNEFAIARNRVDGLGSTCKTCQREERLHARFQITQDQFLVMLVKQGGVCAMCGTPEPGGHGTWNVDHDHACCTEGVRSCGKCIR